MPAHPLHTVATETVHGTRIIRCPHCMWIGRVPKQNALAAAAKLRKQLRQHLETHKLLVDALMARCE